MRLVAFNGGRVGLETGVGIVDVTDIAAAEPGSWPPVGMLRLIADFDACRPALEEALGTRPALPLSEIRRETPIARPGNLFAFPANFHDHIAEMNSAYQANTRGFFVKAASSLGGPEDPIVLPGVDRPIHHECEIAIVVGRGGRHIPAAEAMAHVFGYACLIDVTVRGDEERVMRKSFDSFTPVGPAIITAAEAGPPEEMTIALSVNGAPRQRAGLRDLIIDVPGMIEMVSAVCTLEPGDIIASGTPAGVGPLAAGDSVSIEIEGLIGMTVRVEADAARPVPVFHRNNTARG